MSSFNLRLRAGAIGCDLRNSWRSASQCFSNTKMPVLLNVDLRFAVIRNHIGAVPSFLVLLVRCTSLSVVAIV